MDNKIITTVMTIVVGVIVIGSVLAVTVSDYSTSTLTYTNEGMPYAEVDEDTHTILLKTNTITVDGEDIDLSLFPSGFSNFTIVYGVEDFIRYNILSGGNSISLRGANITNVSVTPTDDAPVTITISGSDVTIAYTATKTFSDAIYFISPDGDYVLTANPTVTDDTVMYGEGETSFGTSAGVPVTLALTTYWTGTTASVTATVLSYTAPAYTSCEVASTGVNATEVVSGLYHIDSVLINYVATYDGTEYNTTSTYTYFLAPITITYDNPNYLGSEFVGLLGAIVVIAVAGILITAVGMIRARD